MALSKTLAHAEYKRSNIIAYKGKRNGRKWGEAEMTKKARRSAQAVNMAFEEASFRLQSS